MSPLRVVSYILEKTRVVSKRMSRVESVLHRLEPFNFFPFVFNFPTFFVTFTISSLKPSTFSDLRPRVFKATPSSSDPLPKLFPNPLSVLAGGRFHITKLFICFDFLSLNSPISIPASLYPFVNHLSFLQFKRYICFMSILFMVKFQKNKKQKEKFSKNLSKKSKML